jgi:sugar fermentation stimulation protein A
LVAVEKETPAGPLLINMDSQAPNRVFREWAQEGNFRPGLTLLRPETKYGNSRFDFYWEAGEKRGFVEVKGVTLEENGVVRFPDAPTERGVKHLEELMSAKAAGYEAAVCFIIQMDGVQWMEPNDSTHQEFGAALRRAAAAGVEVLALSCQVTPDSLTAKGAVPVKL